MVRKSLHEIGETLLHLLNRGDTRRVDVVESRTDQVGVAEFAESVEKLKF